MTALPNPFLTSPAPTSQAVESAVAPNTPPPSAAAGLIEVSPGVSCRSLPSGESDPSVTLDYAPGESRTCGSTESRRTSEAKSGRAGNPTPAPNGPEKRTAGVAPGPQDQFPPGFDPSHAKEVFHYARKLGQTEALLGSEVTHAQWQGRSRHGAYPIDPEHRFILDEQSFIEACLKTDDPMPLFLSAPRKEYLEASRS